MAPDNLTAFVLWDAFPDQAEAAEREITRRCGARQCVATSTACHRWQALHVWCMAVVLLLPWGNLLMPLCRLSRLRVGMARVLKAKHVPRLQFRRDEQSDEVRAVEQAFARLEQERLGG